MSEQKKFCQSCGFKNDPSSKFCLDCGKSFSTDSPVASIKEHKRIGKINSLLIVLTIFSFSSSLFIFIGVPQSLWLTDYSTAIQFAGVSGLLAFFFAALLMTRMWSKKKLEIKSSNTIVRKNRVQEL